VLLRKDTSGIWNRSRGILPHAERPITRSRDENVLAKSVVDSILEELEEEPKPKKDPLAVELGRRGGLKGGKARAEKLSATKRKQIAKKAIKARWNKDAT
jgi:hypothetical protein